MTPRVVRLTCGHERWAPSDWSGESLTCSECDGALRMVALTTPDFDAMSSEERKTYMRALRRQAEAEGER